MKESIKTKLQEMRDAGISTLQRGEERELKALFWVYNWGWASGKTLDRLGGSTSKGLGQRLTKKSFLYGRTVEGGGYKNVPRRIYTLSPAGLSFLTAHLTEAPHRVNHDAHRISVLTLEHDNLGQILALKVNDEHRQVLAPKQFARFSKNNIKQPDCIVLHNKNGVKTVTAIEFELSQKFDKQLDDFVQKCIDMLDQNTQDFKVDGLVIYTKTQHVLDKYKKAFTVGATYQTYRKTNLRWVVSGTKTVPDFVKNKVGYYLVSTLEKP